MKKKELIARLLAMPGNPDVRIAYMGGVRADVDEVILRDGQIVVMEAGVSLDDAPPYETVEGGLYRVHSSSAERLGTGDVCGDDVTYAQAR